MAFDNVLERRIRRMVRTLMQDKTQDQNYVKFGLKLGYDQSQSLLLRIMWTGLLILTTILFVYQTWDRVHYYLSYPVEVDTKLEEMQFTTFPMVAVGNPHTKEIAKIMAEEYISPDDTFPCMNIIGALVESKKYTTEEIWHASRTNSTVINAEIINGKLTLIPETSSIVHPDGYMTVFRSTEEISFRGEETAFNLDLEIYNGSCKSAVFMGGYSPVGEHFDFQNSFMLPPRLRVKFSLSFLKYSFINRPGFSCVPKASMYHECQDNCHLESYKQLKCRLPFVPEEVELPKCIKTSKRDYAFAGQIYKGMNIEHEGCHCSRPCNQYFYDVWVIPEGTVKQGSNLSIYFRDNYITITSERLTYDLISLLSDTGGNMGLCLGLSVLDLMFWVRFLTSKKNQSNKPSFSNTDPILKIVRKVFLRATSQELPVAQSTYKSCKKSLLRWIYTIVCSSIAVYLVSKRIEYFISSPTKNVLQVLDNTTVQYPIVTICWESTEILKMKKALARKKILSDHCNVKLSDLLDSPMTASKIWKASKIGDFYVQMATLKTVDTRLPYGTCTSYVTDPVPNADTFGKFFIFRFPRSDDCDKLIKFIITPPDEVIDPTRYEMLMENVLQFIVLTVKTLDNTNLQYRKVSTAEASDCKMKCLTQKLAEKLKCTMPFVPKMDHELPQCNTSRDALKTEATYLEAFMSTGQELTCSCPRPVQQMMYGTTIIIYPHGFAMTAMLFMFQNTRFQNWLITYSYSIEKLLSELGGSIGAIMGLSIISSVELVYNFCINKRL